MEPEYAAKSAAADIGYGRNSGGLISGSAAGQRLSGAGVDRPQPFSEQIEQRLFLIIDRLGNVTSRTYAMVDRTVGSQPENASQKGANPNIPGQVGKLSMLLDQVDAHLDMIQKNVGIIEHVI